MARGRWHLLRWSVLTATGLAACGSGTPTGPSGGSTTGGSATVMLQDSPFSDAKAVLVTFSEVSVHLSGGDFVKLPFASGGSSRTCDLKKLVRGPGVLGTGPLPPRHYTPIPLVLLRAGLLFFN